MKVYSKRQVNRAIESGCKAIANELKKQCIDAVIDKLSEMVIKKDNSYYQSLQQRIETLEMDMLSNEKLIQPPKPKKSKQRDKVFRKLQGGSIEG